MGYRKRRMIFFSYRCHFCFDRSAARGASNYWAKLKQQLKEGGADKLLTNCQQLKMTASDGKHRATDVAIEKKSLKGVMR